MQKHYLTNKSKLMDLPIIIVGFSTLAILFCIYKISIIEHVNKEHQQAQEEANIDFVNDLLNAKLN